MNFRIELIAFIVGAILFMSASLFASMGRVRPVRDPNKPTPLSLAWWVCVLFATLVTAKIYSVREIYGDTEVYHQNLIMIQEFGYTLGKAWLFNAVAWLILRLASVEMTLTLITMFVCFGVSLGLARYLKDYVGALAASAVMFTSFYCVGIQSNVLTQGLAIAVLMIFLPELLDTKKSLLAVAKLPLICVLASGFHSSVFLIFVPCLLTAYFIRFNVRIAIVVALAATLISSLGGGIESLPFLGEILSSSASFYTGYLDNVNDDRYYKVGLRSDFAIFVWFYALWGIYVWAKLGLKDRRYERVLVLYLLCMSVFLCSFNIPFSDRIGLYCFVLIPLVVGYPLGRVKRLATIDARLLFHLYVGANLVFTFLYFAKF